MKKLISMLAAATAVCTLSASVFAADINANEQAILNAVSGTGFSADIVTMVENYFLGDGVDVTADQAAAFDAAFADFADFCTANSIDLSVLTTDGNVVSAKALRGLSTEVKADLVEYATDICATVNTKFNYDPIKKIGWITDANGVVVASISKAIKQTGSYGAVAGVSAALLALVAVSVATAKRKGLVK